MKCEIPFEAVEALDEQFFQKGGKLASIAMSAMLNYQTVWAFPEMGVPLNH